MPKDYPSTENDKLSAVETVRVEMSGRVRSLASPASPGESVKACIRRVSMRTGLGFGQVRRLWYREWRVVPAHIADKIREAAEAHDRQIARQIEELRKRQAALYGLIHHSQDAEFYSVRAAEPEHGGTKTGGQD